MSKAIVVAKVVAVIVVLVSLIAMVASGINPSASATELIVGTAAALGVIAAGLIVALVCSLQFRQWVLRQGGIDTQWLWFRSDPPGLEQLRKKDRKA